MLVCHCHALSDRAIRKCVRDGAETRKEVAKACGAGSSCGGCLPVVDRIINQSEERQNLGLFRLSLTSDRLNSGSGLPLNPPLRKVDL